MKRNYLILLLILSLLIACFSGCAARKPDGIEEPESLQPADTVGREPESETDPKEEPIQQPVDPVGSPGLTAFDHNLINYLCNTDLGSDNFAVSPLSFKAALALAAEGAEGETLEQLLTVLGFADLEELEAWYATVLAGENAFDSYFEDSRFTDRGDAAYHVINSVWKNEDLPGDFRADYVQRITELMQSEAHSAPAAELTDAVNDWVNRQTEGLIPAILQDAHDASAVLVNALYLKAGWLESFQELGPDAFTTAEGGTVEKRYIQVTGNYLYYEDDSCQLVVVPLQGDMNMIFILGNRENLADKLAMTEWKRTEITLPIFDVETTMDHHELCGFLEAQGCDRMFDDSLAEFDPMFTEPLYVQDIVQKTKVQIDNEGLEAAAATAIVMYGNTAVPGELPEPIVFRADHAFTFCVLNGLEDAELLFWGQIVR